MIRLQILFLSFAIATPASARQGDLVRSPLVAPNTRIQNCTQSGCHSDITDRPFLHGPVAANACEVCHEYADPAAHTFSIKDTGPELCGFCHIGKMDDGGANLHQPVAEGKCLSCHDPHGSQHRMLLSGRTEGESCLACHDAVTDKQHIHAPLVDGTCTSCHRAHSSLYDHLLVAEGKALCLQCHADIATPVEMAALPPLHPFSLGNEAPRVLPLHQPVAQDDCRACHVPHASDHERLLTMSSSSLCASCHSEIAEKYASASFPHFTAEDDRICLRCHAPHGSGVPTLLRDWPISLCMECHSEPVHRSDGSVVQAATDLVNLGSHVHGPVAQGQCGSCHDVHGAEHQKLLKGEYSSTFYQAYEPDAYDFCLTCHDHALVEEKQSQGTGFRNGDRNLHYVHVVEPENGRSCRSCHATHSSESIRQLKEKTTYGNWEIPISFSATTNGGSCAAGCHRARTYDRVDPVSYDVTGAPGNGADQEPDAQPEAAGSSGANR